MIKKEWFARTSILISIFVCYTLRAFCQAELNPWGNLAGIRIDGQLMEFETSLRVVNKDWSQIKATGKERQRPKYFRKGNQQVVTTRIDSISFTETVQDVSKGAATVRVGFTTTAGQSLDGVFFSLALSSGYGPKVMVQADKSKPLVLKSNTGINTNSASTARTLRFTSPSRQLELTFSTPVSMIVREETQNGNHLQLYFPIHTGEIKRGDTAGITISIKSSGTIDRRPIALALKQDKQGNMFDGLGGNFRLQNPKADPQVIDYCLQNLRVAWSRVEMPWRFWQPEKNSNPIDESKSGKLNANVQKAMEMAQRLGKMGIPVIVSAWSGPAWAIVGKPKFRSGPDGVWGNPLDTNSTKEIYRSIADYLIYLKENYGVEASMFSFNESDLGINIRQTGKEHADLIKGLGAYFAERGLKTKLLLGDNSDATSIEFIYPALNDPGTHQYIGAVSFHSWRGWEKELLQKWADAAAKIKRPLLVAEGSIDAQAWDYPAIFEEPTYALQEISLYTRLLSICQPLSILQWQLTSDYSPLVGGGMSGNNGPLRPTQRFWNLKQLASTPKGLQAMALTSNRPDVSCAALGDKRQGVYVLHLVNNGPTRKVSLTGLPKTLKGFRVYLTNRQKAMEAGKAIRVSNGQTNFSLETGTYTTLISQ